MQTPNRMGPPPQRPGQPVQRKPEPRNAVNEVAALMESHKAQIARALPKHLTADRLARICLTELRKSEKLQQCDAMSFMGAVIQAAQLGLEPGSALGECYLVPYKKECQLQLGYKGMAKLAKQGGAVKSIELRTVYEGDDFDFQMGTDGFIHHRPDLKAVKRGEGIAYYAVIKTAEGGIEFDVMGRAEMDYHRQKYTSQYSDAWKDSYDEMAKKTVLIRLLKATPFSPELGDALSVENTKTQDNHKVIDAEYSMPVEQVDHEKWAEVQSGTEQKDEADLRVAIKMVHSSVSQALGRKVQGHAIDQVFGNRSVADWELDATTPDCYAVIEKLNALRAPEVKA